MLELCTNCHMFEVDSYDSLTMWGCFAICDDVGIAMIYYSCFINKSYISYFLIYH